MKNKFIKYKAAALAQKTQRILNSTSEIAKSVIKIGKNPNFANLTSLSVIGLHQLSHFLSNSSLDHNAPTIQKLGVTAGLVAQGIDQNKIINKTVVSDWTIVSYQMENDGIVTHWYAGGHHNFCLDNISEKKALEEVRLNIWKRFGTRLSLSYSATEYEQVISIAPSIVGESFPSDASKNIVKNLKPYLNKNISRSIVFYGAPGTGKSTMVRAIADELKSCVLILEEKDLATSGAHGLKKICEILKPDCVIIDDLDRVQNAHTILDQIEVIKKSVKILLITVNDYSKLGSALLRPGRSDELIEVKRVFDATTFITQLKEYPKINEEVSNWPIAFIEELRNRIEVKGLNEALKDVPKLRKRVELNSEHKNLDPNTFNMHNDLEFNDPF